MRLTATAVRPFLNVKAVRSRRATGNAFKINYTFVYVLNQVTVGGQVKFRASAAAGESDSPRWFNST